MIRIKNERGQEARDWWEAQGGPPAVARIVRGKGEFEDRPIKLHSWYPVPKSFLLTDRGVTYEIVVNTPVDTKKDAGKPNLTYIPYSALELVAKCMEDGSTEHGEANYLNRRPDETKQQHIRRYIAAGLRHAFKAVKTDRDESGHLHLTHAACNFLMAVDIYVNT